MKHRLYFLLLIILTTAFDNSNDYNTNMTNYYNSSWWNNRVSQHNSIVLELVNIAESTEDLENSELRTQTTQLVRELEQIRANVEIRRLEWERVAINKLQKTQHNIEDWKGVRNRKRDITQQIQTMPNQEIRQKYVNLSESSLEISRQFHLEDKWEESRLSLDIASAALDIASSVTPGISWGRDIYEAIFGVDLFSGHQLSKVDQSFAILGAFTGGLTTSFKKFTKVLKRLSNFSSNNIRRSIDVTQHAERMYETSRHVEKVRWGMWSDLPKLIENGQEYAQIGNRKYTRHAIDRMTPVNFGVAANGFQGRGVTTMVVESTINLGELVNTQQLPNGILREVWKMGSVEVITENSKSIVVTVMRRGG